MPITLTGLHALSVETPTTVSTASRARGSPARCSARRSTFVMTASNGWYSQVGTCFIAAAWKTTSASAQQRPRPRHSRGCRRSGSAAAGGAPRRRRCRRSRPGGAGSASRIECWSRLAAREDDDLLGHADLALEQPPHQDLAERAGPAGDDDALTVEQGPASSRVVGVGVGGQLRDHLRPARRPRSRSRAAEAAGVEARSIDDARRPARSRRQARRRRASCTSRSCLSIGSALEVPEAVQRLMALDRCRRSRGREPVSSSPLNTARVNPRTEPPRLTEEPLEQTMARRQLAADHARSGSSGPRVSRAHRAASSGRTRSTGSGRSLSA